MADLLLNDPAYNLATDASLAGVAGPLDYGAPTFTLAPTPDPGYGLTPTTDTPGISTGGTIYSAPIGPVIPSTVPVSANAVQGLSNTTIPPAAPPPTPAIGTGAGSIVDAFINSVVRSGAQAVQRASVLAVTQIPGVSAARNQRRLGFAFAGYGQPTGAAVSGQASTGTIVAVILAGVAAVLVYQYARR
jgi:hypothetical protein